MQEGTSTGSSSTSIGMFLAHPSIDSLASDQRDGIAKMEPFFSPSSHSLQRRSVLLSGSWEAISPTAQHWQHLHDGAG